MVRPPDGIDGMFSARRKTPAGLYTHLDESDIGLGTPIASSTDPSSSYDALQRSSLEGFELNGTGAVTMDQFMGEEDRIKYAIAQRAQFQRSTRSDAKESPDVELIDLSSES